MRAGDYRESPLLSRAGFRHAFFTRRGGVSAGPYASLNFSYGVGDDRHSVDQNFARAAEVLGVAPNRTYFASQVHGRGVVSLSGEEEPERVRALEGDALSSTSTGLACGVRTADCVPILIADEASGGVVAVHAGWRGVEQDIVGAAVAALSGGGGAKGLLAAIGPHITVTAFEVSEDVAQRLFAASPDPDVVRRDLGPKPHVDLARIVRAQLERAGLARARIEDVPGCTVGEPERYFSFRRDGKLSGRHWSAIVPRGG